MSDKLARLEELMRGKFPAADLSRAGDTLVLRIAPAEVVAMMTRLRDDAELDFKMMIDLTAVHYPNRDPQFDVVYHLLSVYQNHRLRVKVGLPEGEPIDSVIPVWGCANWYEREMYEMFGILVRNHPDLRRLLTDYDFDGFPLRKDFPLSGHHEMLYDPELQRVVRVPKDLTRADTRPERRYYNRDESC